MSDPQLNLPSLEKEIGYCRRQLDVIGKKSPRPKNYWSRRRVLKRRLQKALARAGMRDPVYMVRGIRPGKPSPAEAARIAGLRLLMGMGKIVDSEAGLCREIISGKGEAA